MTTSPKRLWKSEYFQTVIMIVLIVSAVFVFWFGLKAALNTDYPMLAVASGSMSLVQPDSAWSYPFDRTLHTGDLIIVQGVNGSDIHPGPAPVGDIVVFWNPDNLNELVVHRAIAWYNPHTILETQGDGNSGPGPPFGAQAGAVPVHYVVGKVVFRIPWIGNLALLMRDSSGVYVVIALIIIIIIVELALPLFSRSKKTETEQKETSDKSSEA